MMSLIDCQKAVVYYIFCFCFFFSQENLRIEYTSLSVYFYTGCLWSRAIEFNAS